MNPGREAVRTLDQTEIERLERAATAVATLRNTLMASAVFGLSSAARAEGDTVLASTYRFLYSVLLPRVDAMARVEESTNPFWVQPGSLTEQEIEVLRGVVNVGDPELRSRFADFLWLKTRDRSFGEIAVDAYLASAFRLRHPENWSGSADRYERAVSLAASLGKKNQRYKHAIEVVEQYLAELDATDPLFLSAKLMQILLAQGEGDPAHYAEVAERCARASETRDNLEVTLRYWNLTARWRAAMEDPAGEQVARIAGAESMVTHAARRAAGDEPSLLAATDFLRRGIAMLRNAGGSAERMAELMIRLDEYGAKSKGELKPLQATVDMTEIVRNARAAVAGRSLGEAIRALADLVDLPKRDDVKRDVLRAARDFPMQHLFPDVLLNAEGVPVAGRGSIGGNEEEESDAVLTAMYSDVLRCFSMDALGRIEPARRQIRDEHEVNEDDLAILVQQSWFIPPSRQVFFSKGLTAGFRGDFVTAIHLLVPQMESTLRWHLGRKGVVTAKLNRYGFQEHRDLNELLRMPETAKFLGADLQFALAAILTSRYSNLRNELAHGLVEPRDCHSTIAVFFWALVLMVCIETMPEPQELLDRDASRSASSPSLR